MPRILHIFMKVVYRASILTLLSFFASCGSSSISISRADEPEQLLIFTQHQTSQVQTIFEDKYLPAIQTLAAKMGVPVHLIDIRKGVPREVGLTPLLVYQNHRGRSIYQGRYTTLGRIRNFLRTASFVPQEEVPLHRRRIPIWQMGRTRVWAPLKIAKVTGSPPGDYNHTDFEKMAFKEIAAGFKHFKLKNEAGLNRADRGFFMDFNPWLSADNKLYLSLVLFSQFHCEKPVFKMQSPPLIGSWQDRGKMFREAAAILEAEVLRRVNDPLGGDGFDPVSAKTPQKTWQDMGFALPPTPLLNAVKEDYQTKLKPRWEVAPPGADEPPLIQFYFPAPLDQYRGEVTRVSGALKLGSELKMDGAAGYFQVDTQTAVTMGDPMLDQAIKGSLILNTSRFPAARFDLETVLSDGRPVSFGHLTPVSIKGRFTLKGKTVPLTLIAESEPVISRDGQPRLQLRCRFKIDLRQFDIEGAEGPAPSRHTLVMIVNLNFRPAT